MIGIRETSAPDSWSLLFMEPPGEDTQDSQLDMDTYCLVAGPGQATCYGGVRECELGSGRLHLKLTAETAGTLGMPADTSFALELLTPQQVDMLGRGLARALTSGRASELPQRLSI
jgi:hypothetical protein